MTSTHVALIRGINVGRAKRVAMADLRALFEGLGYADVRTLLNSGNVVFTVKRATAADPASRIEKALVTQLGVSARVTVLTAEELATAVQKNPLGKIANDPSRLLVTVFSDPADRAKLKSMLTKDWERDALALGARVAYVWCADGILASPLADAIQRTLGDAVTSRNWATMSKLHALTQSVE